MSTHRPILSLEAEGRALVERLGGRWGPAGGVCRCPAHDDHRPSLSVRPGRTRLLLHCFAGCDAADILRALESARLIHPNGGTLRELARPCAGDPLGGAALRIWNEARAICGTRAEVYLARRGLRTSSPQLRFHPRTPHGRAPFTRYRPALIAAVRDNSGLVAIHRTFLDPEGRPPGTAGPKCGLGRFGSGAVRLGGSALRLGLAEGIETALSASALFGLPCWAALGTERFRLVALPSEVRELLLFLDHDGGGHRAGQLARETFTHIPHIETHVPDRPGDDWNDVLRAALPATGT